MKQTTNLKKKKKKKKKGKCPLKINPSNKYEFSSNDFFKNYFIFLKYLPVDFDREAASVITVVALTLAGSLPPVEALTVSFSSPNWVCDDDILKEIDITFFFSSNLPNNLPLPLCLLIDSFFFLF